MSEITTGERWPDNRQKAKPPPATTTHHYRVYNITRIELEEIQLAKPEHERNT